jgi:type VI secretion system activator RovC-like protein
MTPAARPSRTPMKTPPLDPDIADLAPAGPALTDYDEKHVVTYIRLLDADRQGADWRDVSRIVLSIDPGIEAERARLAFESHLSRAKWITEQGYRHLLRSPARAT